VRVVGSLVGEVLDEQQIIRLGRVPVHPEGQGAFLRAGAERRELPHDVLDLVLHAFLQLDGKYLDQHGQCSGPSAASAAHIRQDGRALDDGGTEAALADRTGVSARHLRRLFLQHLGATPDQLARSRRAHFARRLLDDTELTAADVAFASGFGSLRQFNRAMQEAFRASPTDLRRRRHRADRLVVDGGLALRLPVLPGYDWAAVRAFLGARAVPRVGAVNGTSYRRTITVGGAAGLVEVEPGEPGNLLLRVHLPYWEGLIHLVGRISRLLGADTEHAAGAAVLAADPVLGPLARQRPGLVVPGIARSRPASRPSHGEGGTPGRRPGGSNRSRSVWACRYRDCPTA
jgi:AraC-like DNA-binding protein